MLLPFLVEDRVIRMHCIFFVNNYCEYDSVMPPGRDIKEPQASVTHNDVTTYCKTENFSNCPRFIALMEFHRIKHGVNK